MNKTINGTLFRSMLVTAGKLFEINRPSVDALNVFPVPDGDTGTNMCFTMQSAVKMATAVASNNLGDIADAASKGALRGARGNSGVILSQIMRGLCSGIRNSKEVDTKTFAKALSQAAEVAYGAVSVPTEGTILTVIRMIAEHARSIWLKNKEFEPFLAELIKKGEEAVALTPTLLPVLKKAGVVDAGGQGLLSLFEGMYKALIGEDVSVDDEPKHEEKPESSFDHTDPVSMGNIEFGYCTEFFIINIKKRTTIADIEQLKVDLMKIGDCVIVIGDLEFVKVHVHTNLPGRALTLALKLGELDKVKIENMLEQNRQLKKKYEAEKKEVGMLAVSSGDGIAAIFKDLQVDAILEGGQTMNPSASDIADAIQRINAENVFVFPNNKNIILAAEQAKSLVENRTVHVVPTKNIPEGFAAAMSFNAEVSVEENKANMIHAQDTVTVAQVTKAVKNARVDGFEVKTGDIIGLDNKKILARGKNVADVVLKLLTKIRSDEQTITLYYGADVTEGEANELAEKIQETYPDCDVETLYGGQPLYYYYVSLE